MIKTTITSLIVMTFLVISFIGMNVKPVDAVMPVPTAQQVFKYSSIASPVVNDDPAQARPLSFGSIAEGGDMLSAQIGFSEFSGPVDIFVAFTISTDPSHFFVLNSDLSFKTLTIDEIAKILATGMLPSGVGPWKENTIGPINEHFFNLAISEIPSGTFTCYVLVSPTGNIQNYYLWKSFFVGSSGVNTSRQFIEASTGGTINVQNSNGDTIILTIPPNALDDSTTISLTTLDTPPINPVAKNIFPGIIIEPKGILLNDPAIISVNLADTLNNPKFTLLYWVQSPSLILPVANQISTSTNIEGEVSHFSSFVAGQPTMEEADKQAKLLRDLEHDLLDDPYGWWDTELKVNAFLQYSLLFDTLGNAALADEAFQSALGWMEEGALKFLNHPVPADPCGLYRTVLYRFSGAVQDLFGDGQLFQFFRDRSQLVEIDNMCTDISGSWVVSFSGSQTCTAEGFQWVESDAFDANLEVTQTGKSVSAIFTDAPGSGTYRGEATATANRVEPVSYSFSLSSSDTPDCVIFFQSNAQDIGFGEPICEEDMVCEPISCFETETNTGNVSADGMRTIGISVWTFSASVRMFSEGAPPVTVSLTCEGTGEFSATKQ